MSTIINGTSSAITFPDATVQNSAGLAAGGTIATGTITALSTSGITFPATQVPSADANTLDDYEEGTWTPVDASGSGLTFTTPYGTPTYTKIGRSVTVIFTLVFPSTASTNAIQIGGLPFTTSSYGAGAISYNDTSFADRTFLFQNGVTYLQIRSPVNNRTNANYSTAQIICMGTYFV
jgi:hypothetical protein